MQVVQFLELLIRSKHHLVQFVVILLPLLDGKFLLFIFYNKYMSVLVEEILFMVAIQKKQPNVKLSSGSNQKNFLPGTEMAPNIYMTNTPTSNATS